MRIWAGVVLGALAGVAAAQGPLMAGVAGPPACGPAAKLPNPEDRGKTVKPVTPVRPSVVRAVAIAELAAADPSVLMAAEPMENFGVARYRLADYGECLGDGGCYWRDLDAQFQRAEFALATAVAKHGKGEKLALVLDIDETTLSSYCEMKREDYGYQDAAFNKWVVSGEAAVGIPGTLRLYRQARAAGVAVFFLTGRPESQREGTEKNLRTVGFTGWAGLVLRSAEEKGMPPGVYKALERGKMVAAGYTLVMNVGDQWSDLSGEPRADVNVKLPNPFYFLP